MKFKGIIFIILILIALVFLGGSDYGIDLKGDYGGIVEEAFSFAYILMNKGFITALRDFIIASKIPPITVDRFLVFIASLPYLFVAKIDGVASLNMVIVSNIAKLSVIFLKLLLIYVLLHMFLNRNITKYLIVFYTILIFLLDNYWLSSILSDALDRPLMEVYALVIAIIYSYLFYNNTNFLSLLILTSVSWLVSIYHPHTILIALALSIAFMVAYLLFNPRKIWIIFYSQFIMIISFVLHFLFIYPFNYGYGRSILSYILSTRELGMDWFNSFLVLNTEKVSWTTAQDVGYLNLGITLVFILALIATKHEDIRFKFSRVVFLSLLLLMYLLVNYHTFNFIHFLIYKITSINDIFLIRALSRFYSLYGIIIAFGFIGVSYSFSSSKFTLYLKKIKYKFVIFSSLIVLLILIHLIYTFNLNYLSSIENYSYINNFYNKAINTYYDNNSDFYGTLILDPNIPMAFTLNTGAYDIFQTNDILWAHDIANDYIYRLFGIRYVVQNNGSIVKFNKNSRFNNITGILVPLTNLGLSLKSAGILNAIGSCSYETDSYNNSMISDVLDLRSIFFNDTKLKIFTVVVIFYMNSLNNSLSSILALGDPSKGHGFWIAQDYDFLTIEMNLNGEWIKVSSPRVLQANSTYLLIMVFDGDKGILYLYLNGVKILEKHDLKDTIFDISKTAYIGNTPEGNRSLNGKVYFAGIIFKALNRCETVDIMRYLLIKQRILEKFDEFKLPLTNISLYNDEINGVIIPISLQESLAILNSYSVDSLNLPIIVLFDNYQDIRLFKLILANEVKIIPFYTLIERYYAENLLLSHTCGAPLVRLGVPVPIDHRIFNTFSIASYNYDKVLISNILVDVNYNNYKCFNELMRNVIISAHGSDKIILRTEILGTVTFEIRYHLSNGEILNKTITIDNPSYNTTYIILTLSPSYNENSIINIELYIKSININSNVILDTLILVKNYSNVLINETEVHYIEMREYKDFIGKTHYELVLTNSDVSKLLYSFNRYKAVLGIYNPGYRMALHIDKCNYLMKTEAGFSLYLCNDTGNFNLMQINVTNNIKSQILILFFENCFNIYIYTFILYFLLKKNPIKRIGNK